MAKPIAFEVQATVSGKAKDFFLVVPFWKKGKKVQQAGAAPADVKKLAEAPISKSDFSADEGECLLLYDGGRRLLLVGLGDAAHLSDEICRVAYATAAQWIAKKGVQEVLLFLPATDRCHMAAVVEGLILASYQFQGYKTEKEAKAPLEKVIFIGATSTELKQAKRTQLACEGVTLARDLINSNADDITPEALVAAAKAIGKNSANIQVTVFNKARIEKEKLGLLLAVSRGSSVDPAFIIASYRGAPKSKEHLVLVGKGVTYDTGGLNIKTAPGMERMKRDMSGAAAVLGALHSAVKLQMKANVTAVIPTAENCIDAKSYKPGDVYYGYSGKSVEIGNTDAEGRLLLADALAYSVKNLKPTKIVDIATLTGAVVVALGDQASGLMSNNDSLAAAIEKAGEKTHERVWRLPLYKEYTKQLKSDIADLRNIGNKGAGTIVAGSFLQEFVGETVPWAHLDIAGTAYQEGGTAYQEKMATGVGVRLFLSLIEDLFS